MKWIQASERLPKNLVAYKPIRITVDGVESFGIGAVRSYYKGPKFYDAATGLGFEIETVEWLETDETPSTERTFSLVSKEIKPDTDGCYYTKWTAVPDLIGMEFKEGEWQHKFKDTYIFTHWLKPSKTEIPAP